MKDFGMGICRGCGVEFKKAMPHQVACSRTCMKKGSHKRLSKEQKAKYEKKKQSRDSVKIRCREIAKYNFPTPEPCEACGAQATDRHHDNYNKPLEIRWLCSTCHKLWHKHNKAIQPVKAGQQIALGI